MSSNLCFQRTPGFVLRKDPRPEERWYQEPHQEDRAVIQAGGEAAWTVGLAWMVGQGGRRASSGLHSWC